MKAVGVIKLEGGPFCQLDVREQRKQIAEEVEK